MSLDLADEIPHDPREGYEVRVMAYYDPDVSPLDFDCYSQSEIDAYYDNQWCYVSIFVEVLRDGEVRGTAAVSGVEYGWLGETRCELDDYADTIEDLLNEALFEARGAQAPLPGLEGVHYAARGA